MVSVASRRAPLRVLVAPDKFKGTLSAQQAAQAIWAGVRIAAPDAAITMIPIADGGEGTIDALVERGARLECADVSGPLGEPVGARWAVLGETAVIELAAAAGLHHVSEALSPATAMASNTRGVGQLIRAVLDDGYRSLLVGIGGSATTDGGFGAITELGLRVYDDEGRVVTDVTQLAGAERVDSTQLDPRLAECRLVIATDVSSTLIGVSGAARMFAPQKGADPATVERLERRLQGWADLLQKHTGAQVADVPGTGAAGGFAAPFVALGLAEIRSGAEEIMTVLGLESAMADSDVVVVGEGSLDHQSLHGKGPIAIARRAARYGAVVVAVCGRSTLNSEQRGSAGISAVGSLTDLADVPEEAFVRAGPLLTQTTTRVFRAILPILRILERSAKPPERR